MVKCINLIEMFFDLLPAPRDELEANYRQLVTELIYNLDTITITIDEDE